MYLLFQLGLALMLWTYEYDSCFYFFDGDVSGIFRCDDRKDNVVGGFLQVREKGGTKQVWVPIVCLLRLFCETTWANCVIYERTETAHLQTTITFDS